MSNLRSFPNFPVLIQKLSDQFLASSHLLHARRWQGMEVIDRPEMATHELLNTSFEVPLPTENLDHYRNEIKPNLPWADDHFLERVGGEPLNPGVQWAKWPFAASADRFRDSDGGQFTHTYMERYWPRFAGKTKGGITKPWPDQNSDTRANRGIRYEVGDLNDVVSQLAFEPDTRQAFLPVWFPEDTGGVHKGRLPCSIGYHFIQRFGRLHVVYWLRSCDFVRHFRDDIYLTLRLMFWVRQKSAQLNPDPWRDIKPGTIAMHITSFHMFRNDYRTLYGKEAIARGPDHA